jgi:hypothetical protein
MYLFLKAKIIHSMMIEAKKKDQVPKQAVSVSVSVSVSVLFDSNPGSSKANGE